MTQKRYILRLMDELVENNTASNAQLVLLYEEVEKLCNAADENHHLRQTIVELNDEVTKLRSIQHAAVEYLKALERQQGDTTGRLSRLSTAVGHKTPKEKSSEPIDPNKTMPPNPHLQD